MAGSYNGNLHPHIWHQKVKCLDFAVYIILNRLIHMIYSVDKWSQKVCDVNAQSPAYSTKTEVTEPKEAEGSGGSEVTGDVSSAYGHIRSSLSTTRGKQLSQQCALLGTFLPQTPNKRPMIKDPNVQNWMKTNLSFSWVDYLSVSESWQLIC